MATVPTPPDQTESDVVSDAEDVPDAGDVPDIEDTPILAEDLSPRARLLEAALRLFSTVGFEGTAVGDIEEAAGFTRRGGTMYRHFASKDELLVAALQYSATQRSRTPPPLPAVALPDLRSELFLAATCVLQAMDEARRTVNILEKSGSRLARAGQFSPDMVVSEPYRAAREFLAARAPETDWDLDAVVVLLYGGLGAVRRNEWTFGSRGLDVADERLVATWAQLVEQVLLPATSSA